MNKLLTVMTLSFAVTACHHKGPVMSESGVVIEKQYSGDTRKTDVGYGITSDGKMVTVIHTSGEDEKFLLVLKCQHNIVFTVNDAMSFANCGKGDTVTIKYQEILTRKGKVVDFHFLSAAKR